MEFIQILGGSLASASLIGMIGMFISIFPSIAASNIPYSFVMRWVMQPILWVVAFSMVGTFVGAFSLGIALMVGVLR